MSEAAECRQVKGYGKWITKQGGFMKQDDVIFMTIVIAVGVICLTFFIFLGHLIFNEFLVTKTKTNDSNQKRLTPVKVPMQVIPVKSNS